MSKEMLVIALGLWIILVRTMLGVPGNWQTAIFIVTGVVLAVIGFLLRGEALARAAGRSERTPRGTYSFVENTSDHPASPSAHEQKEGITSLN